VVRRGFSDILNKEDRKFYPKGLLPAWRTTRPHIQKLLIVKRYTVGVTESSGKNTANVGRKELRTEVWWKNIIGRDISLFVHPFSVRTYTFFVRSSWK